MALNPLTLIRQHLPQWPSRAGQSGAAGGVIPPGELQSLSSGQPISLGGAPGVERVSFGQVLGQAVQEVNAKQATAAQTVRDLQAGQNVSLHQAMIAMEEASVSFQLMVEVRNKLLEAYQELMRMQV
jgi:flagellar hook-basal body complex protein FliE